jgi:hypothetical protein
VRWRLPEGEGEGEVCGWRVAGVGVFYTVRVFLNGPAEIYGSVGPISVGPVGLSQVSCAWHSGKRLFPVCWRRRSGN